MKERNDAPAAAHADLTARNFPSAEQELQKQAPLSLYDGPESAYKLAFADTRFLLREELRPVRMQLELLKPELVQAINQLRGRPVLISKTQVVENKLEKKDN